MGTSPTSQSALLSGAAKDDVVGDDGITFTIRDLLANDPGGAAKLGISLFFFGSSASFGDQKAYLDAHHITYDPLLTSFSLDTVFTLNALSTDFQYMVQIGNKGTWSQGDVEVNAPAPHLGGTLFLEDFESYSGTPITDPLTTTEVATTVNMSGKGWTNTGGHTELGYENYGPIDGATGNWLDTQNSPGGINITNSFVDSTAAVLGKTAELSFDISTQSLVFNGQLYETADTDHFTFQIDGVTVWEADASDFANPNDMQHVEVDIASYFLAGNNHTLTLIDSGTGNTGFAVDNIKISDWVA